MIFSPLGVQVLWKQTEDKQNLIVFYAFVDRSENPMAFLYMCTFAEDSYPECKHI